MVAPQHLWPTSLAYAITIFVVAAVGGGIPLAMRVQPGGKGAIILDLGTMFGAGVFIAAGFVHLLGDASGSLDVGDGYPYAMLWCAIGVLIPLIIDTLADAFASSMQQRHNPPEAIPPTRGASKSVHLPESELISTLARSTRLGVFGTEDDELAPGPEPSRSRLVGLVGTFVLFLALTVHSFIAGLVLGVSGDTISVFVAIIAALVVGSTS